MDTITEARQVAAEFGARLIYVVQEDGSTEWAAWRDLPAEAYDHLFPFQTFVVSIGGGCHNTGGCPHAATSYRGVNVEVRQWRPLDGNESHWVIRCPECMRKYLAWRWPDGMPAPHGRHLTVG